MVRRKLMQPIRVTLMSLACGLCLLAASSGAQDQGWDVVQIPRAIDTEYGILARAFRQELNDAGQVAAMRTNRLGTRSVVIRFHVATGQLDVINPSGRALHIGWMINEPGQIFGYTFKEGAILVAQTGVFLDTPGEGTDLLEDGGTPAIWSSFWAWDLTDRGEITGSVFKGGRAFLYSKELGWTDLTPLDKRLRAPGGFAAARTISARGDILFTVATPGLSPSYLWQDDRLVDLNQEGFWLNSPRTVNDQGALPGTVANQETQRAYFYSPDVGLMKIHPKRFRHTAGGFINSEGVVVGVFSDDGRMVMEGIFTFDVRRPRGTRWQIRARRWQFESLLPAGTTFANIDIVDVNESLELVGRVTGVRETGAREEIYVLFYMSSDGELLSLHSALEAAGIVFEAEGVDDINNVGQILLHTRDSLGVRYDYVLTPR